jgi:hypothetical protein
VLRFLHRWRRWIIFVSLLAATCVVWWVTTPRPARSWCYDVSELEQADRFWLQSISPDERWLLIRRTNQQKQQFLDFIDLRTGRVEKTWRRNDADAFWWDESNRIIASSRPKNEYWLRDSHLIADANPRYYAFDLLTGGEKEITREKMKQWFEKNPPFGDKFSIYSSPNSGLKEWNWDTKELHFHAIRNEENQSFQFRIARRNSNETFAELEIPWKHCLQQSDIVGEVVPKHPWLLFEGVDYLSEWFPGLFKAAPWLTRLDLSHHEFRLVDLTAGKSDCFFTTWGWGRYLVSSQGFFLHTRNASQHIIEFWPWPVGQRNWWWLLAPWGCALLLWIAKRAMKRNNRVAVT